VGRRLHCVSRLACYVQSYKKHEESQGVSVFRLRVNIERRADAPVSLFYFYFFSHTPNTFQFLVSLIFRCDHFDTQRR